MIKSSRNVLKSAARKNQRQEMGNDHDGVQDLMYSSINNRRKDQFKRKARCSCRGTFFFYKLRLFYLPWCSQKNHQHCVVKDSIVPLHLSDRKETREIKLPQKRCVLSAYSSTSPLSVRKETTEKKGSGEVRWNPPHRVAVAVAVAVVTVT